MRKYRPREKAPKFTMKPETLDLLNCCPDVRKITLSLAEWIDWARQRNREGEPPEPPEFDRLEARCFRNMVDEADEGFRNYWAATKNRIADEGKNSDTAPGTPPDCPGGDAGAMPERPASAPGGIQGSAKTDQPNDQSSDPLMYPPNQPIPTLDDVLEYAQEKGYGTEAAKGFFEAKTADGWMANGEPVRKWRAVFDSWQRRLKPVHAANCDQRPLTEADLDGGRAAELMREAAEQEEEA